MPQHQYELLQLIRAVHVLNVQRGVEMLRQVFFPGHVRELCTVTSDILNYFEYEVDEVLDDVSVRVSDTVDVSIK
jgi:hypothetical protein